MVAVEQEVAPVWFSAVIQRAPSRVDRVTERTAAGDLTVDDRCELARAGIVDCIECPDERPHAGAMSRSRPDSHALKNTNWGETGGSRLAADLSARDPAGAVISVYGRGARGLPGRDANRT